MKLTVCTIVLLLHSLGVLICVVHLKSFWIWVLEFMEGVGGIIWHIEVNAINSLNRYTTGTSIGLRKGLNANFQQWGNNQFSNAVTAAVANPLVALAKPLYPMGGKPVDLLIILVTAFLSSITSITVVTRY